MKKFIKCSFILFLLFSTIYPVVWFFLPVTITRLIELSGLAYFFLIYNKKRKPKNQTFRIIGYFLIVIIYSLFIFFLNGHFDSAFIKFLFSPLMSLGSALLICITIGKRLSTGVLVDYIIYAALIQAIISFSLFTSPSLYESVMSLIQFDDIQRANVYGLVAYRLIGVGNSIWFAAANYGVDLLLLSSLPYCHGSLLYKNKPLYIASIIIFILAGILSARTFFLVFVVLFMYMYMIRVSNIQFIRSLGKIVFIGLFSLLAVLYLASIFIDVDRLEIITSWAFEMFKSLEDGGSMETKSSNRIIEMYHAVPDNLSGWFFGEAYFENEDGSYYKTTDIGYIRLILCFGIVGLLLYISTLFYFYKRAGKLYDKTFRHLLKCIFFFELILLSKGVISLSIYVSLFYVSGVLVKLKKV